MSTGEADLDTAALRVYLDARRPAQTRERAFRELMERHAHRVFAVCHRVLGSHADAEEATQETFVRLARAAEGFRGEAALSTWLYRVAHNVCTDLVRREARRPRTPVADIAAIADGAGEVEVGAEEQRAALGAVGDALRHLDDRSRTLLLLVAVDGLSYAEAAEATDLAVGTVKSRVSRARLRLGELLAEPDDVHADPPHDRRPSPGASRAAEDDLGARGPP